MEDGAPELAPPADRGTGPVAVVGAGWAGCAAAVTLAQAGIAVTLFEQAKTPGGRARRVAVDGRTLDNGQHLLIGAYRQTLALMANNGIWQQAQSQFSGTLTAILIALA